MSEHYDIHVPFVAGMKENIIAGWMAKTNMKDNDDYISERPLSDGKCCVISVM